MPERRSKDLLNMPAKADGGAAEVAPGILRVEAPLGERLNALYALSGDDALLIMDTGTASDPPGPLAGALRERGADPAQIRFVVNEFLALSRDFVARLDVAVAGVLRRGRWTLGDLALGLGPRLGDWPADAHPIMRFPLLGHLERMVARGDATAERLENRLVYRRAAA